MTILPLFLCGLLAWHSVPSPVGHWRAVLDLAGGPLRFGLEVTGVGSQLRGKLCNGRECQTTDARLVGDSLILDIEDYRHLLENAGLRVQTAEDTDRFGRYFELYRDMITMHSPMTR